MSVEDLNDALRDETDESEGEAGTRHYLPPFLIVFMGRGTDESEGEAGIRYYLPPCLLVHRGGGGPLRARAKQVLDTTCHRAC